MNQSEIVAELRAHVYVQSGYGVGDGLVYAVINDETLTAEAIDKFNKYLGPAHELAKIGSGLAIIKHSLPACSNVKIDSYAASGDWLAFHAAQHAGHVNINPWSGSYSTEMFTVSFSKFSPHYLTFDTSQQVARTMLKEMVNAGELRDGMTERELLGKLAEQMYSLDAPDKGDTYLRLMVLTALLQGIAEFSPGQLIAASLEPTEEEPPATVMHHRPLDGQEHPTPSQVQPASDLVVATAVKDSDIRK